MAIRSQFIRLFVIVLCAFIGLAGLGLYFITPRVWYASTSLSISRWLCQGKTPMVDNLECISNSINMFASFLPWFAIGGGVLLIFTVYLIVRMVNAH